MGDTQRSQTMSPENQGIAEQLVLDQIFSIRAKLQDSKKYGPNGVSLVGFSIGIELMETEEPYEGNLHVRVCGGSTG